MNLRLSLYEAKPESKPRAHTFLLEVQDDGGVEGRHGEVGEGPVLQLQVQSDGAQVRLPAQRPHGLEQPQRQEANIQEANHQEANSQVKPPDGSP